MRSGNLIVDLQFGSTGKGLIAGFLAERDNPDTLITAWAANAGHTYIDRAGNKYVHTMLANGVVSRKLSRVLIGPGSLIDPVALDRELQACGHLLRNAEVLIHPHAAVITQEHRDLEAGPMTKIGSTKKGVGEAAIQRIRRDPDNMNVAGNSLEEGPHPALVDAGLSGLVCTINEYNNAVDRADRVLIEGAQGYSLSMYHGFYPYTTSRDVSTHQILADCGIPAKMGRRINVIGTARAFPIRVANRYDESGAQVGWSGPCYEDQQELDWQRHLGREPELTTVTKLPRRIFTLSAAQLRDAARMCGVDSLFLNFVNYCATAEAAFALVQDVNQMLARDLAYTAFVGMGATCEDIFDMSSMQDSAADEQRCYRSLATFIASYYDGSRTRA